MSMLSLTVGLSLLAGAAAAPKTEFETDTIKTANGDLTVTLIGHGTLMFRFGELVVHVDPVGTYADYAKLPKADVILVTHEHGDHLDKDAIGKITKEGTTVLVTETVAKQLGSGTVIRNGEEQTVKGLKIEAVPAYNLAGKTFHPKGVGNGYVLTFGDKRVYVAGDTENIPEMEKLAGVDVVFLPMNLPYTMTPQQVADAVKVLKPKIVYPYHFGKTDTSELVKLLKDVEGVEVRIRKMQ